MAAKPTRATYIVTAITMIAALASPGLALAHSDASHTHSLMNGLLHPLTGIDHLITLLAIGLWASMQAHRKQLAIPMNFIAVMGVSAVLAMTGIAIPLIETGILLGLIIISLLLVANKKSTLTLSIAIASSIAIFHGSAHGVEWQGTFALLYCIGFLSSTTLLMGSAYCFGKYYLQNNHSSGFRYAGLFAAATSAYALLA